MDGTFNGRARHCRNSCGRVRVLNGSSGDKAKDRSLGTRATICAGPVCFARAFGPGSSPRWAPVPRTLFDFSYVGSTFLFGELGKADSNLGFIFALQVLPTIIFIAAFFAVLYHFGVMQLIIRGAAWVMTVIMGASGAESLNVAASIFMGQTEAPLTIRPFLPKLTKSELMTVMTSGMAHISGGMMAAYIRVGGADAKNPADRGHHDRARDAADGQDAGAGDRAAADGRAGADARYGEESNVLGRHRPRHRRRPASGAERGRHADRRFWR